MKSLELLDVCYPDYFAGYNRPVIAVPVHNNMTIAELAEGIESEINACYSYFREGNAAFTKTEMLIIDEYVNTLKQRGNDIFMGNELEDNNEDFCCFAYLSICKPVYSCGIKFLN